MSNNIKETLKNKLSSGKLLSTNNLEALIDLTVNNPSDIITSIESNTPNTVKFNNASGKSKILNVPTIDADDINPKNTLSKMDVNNSNVGFDLVNFYDYYGTKVKTIYVPKTNLSNKIDTSKIASLIESKDNNTNVQYTLKNYDDGELNNLVVDKLTEESEEEIDQEKILSTVISTEDSNNFNYSFQNYNNKEIGKIVSKKPSSDGPYYYISDVIGFNPDFKGISFNPEYNLSNLKIQGTVRAGTDDKPNHAIAIYDSHNYNNFSCDVSIGDKTVTVNAILSMYGQDKYNMDKLSKLTLISKENDKTNTTVQLMTNNTDELASSGIYNLSFIIGKHDSFDPDKGTQKNIIPYGTTNFKLVPNVKNYKINEIFNIYNKDLKDKTYVSDYFFGQKFITQLQDDGTIIGYHLKVKVTKNKDNDSILDVVINNNTYSKDSGATAHFYDLNIKEEAINIKLIRVASFFDGGKK